MLCWIVYIRTEIGTHSVTHQTAIHAVEANIHLASKPNPSASKKSNINEKHGKIQRCKQKYWQNRDARAELVNGTLARTISPIITRLSFFAVLCNVQCIFGPQIHSL